MARAHERHGPVDEGARGAGPGRECVLGRAAGACVGGSRWGGGKKRDGARVRGSRIGTAGPRTSAAAATATTVTTTSAATATTATTTATAASATTATTTATAASAAAPTTATAASAARCRVSAKLASPVVSERGVEGVEHLAEPRRALDFGPEGQEVGEASEVAGGEDVVKATAEEEAGEALEEAFPVRGGPVK